ncbi:MATE family efflux transporter [Mesoaciditoga lauensis]|uniref:MATE family efflux transporter n=1 Tax=Mesoaciditoga lauensis TaxID=1495039 RepID=UPI000564CB15|nr:MATE family efflux transporter [Mesoaciditoga lauensis]
MKKEKIFDYTSSSIPKSILRLAIPSMGASFLSSLYDLVDAFWVGHISSSAIAGVTLAMAIFWYGSIFNDLFGSASVVLISRRYGEKNYEGVKWVVGQTILAKSVLAMIFLTIVYLLNKELLILVGASGDVLSQGEKYLVWRSWVMPFSFSGYTLLTNFRATGDTYKLFWVQGISAVINMILDPILIYTFHMGVAGAALASDFSEIYLLIVGFIILNSKSSYLKMNPFRYLKPQWEIIKKMVSLGSPMTLDTLSENVAYSVVLRIASTYGTVLIAALGIANRVRSISFTLSFSMNMSASTMVGQNLGAKKKERALKSVKSSIFIGELLIASYVLIIFFFGKEISYFFTPHADIAAIGGILLKFFAINEIFFMISMVSWGVLIGGGLTKTVMFIGIISNWGVLVPLMTLFSSLHLSWIFLALSFVISSGVMASLSLFEIKKGKWLEKKV